MATTDNIQATVGPLLCFFFNNNSSSVDVYLFVLCHLHEHDIHFALVFGGLTQICQQYFRYNKVAFHGIIFPNDQLGLGKCAFC